VDSAAADGRYNSRRWFDGALAAADCDSAMIVNCIARRFGDGGLAARQSSGAAAPLTKSFKQKIVKRTDNRRFVLNRPHGRALVMPCRETDKWARCLAHWL
jgi:hypothetical protein